MNVPLYQPYNSPIPALYQPYTSPIPALYQPYTSPIPALYQPYTSPIRTLYQPYTSLIPALYHSIPALYQPYTSPIPVQLYLPRSPPRVRGCKNYPWSIALRADWKINRDHRARLVLSNRDWLAYYTNIHTFFMHWKLKRTVSAPKCQFGPTGDSLIQHSLEPFERNLSQKSYIKRLFQPSVGPISAQGPNQP